MKSKIKTSLIIPAYNEEDGLSKVIEESQGKVDEIIVVDDGSTDGTHEVAKKYDVRVFRHDKNMGKVAAIRTGIKEASGDIIVLTDADYTYPASYIPQLINEIEDGADLVLGSRFMMNATNVPWLNKMGNMLFSTLATYISCVHITDGQTGFRAFRRKDFQKLDVKAKGLEYETKMTVRAARLGYTIVEIPIEYRKRIGKSKLNPIIDGYKMLSSLLSILMSETSLITKTIMLPTLILFLVGIIFGIISIIEKITYIHLVHEYYPLVSVFMILFSLQLFSIVLIIDYLTKKLDRIDEKIKKIPSR